MSLCRSPIYVKAAAGIVPCGQCQPCRINRRKKKTTRLVLEGQMHEHSLFATLTYDDAHLPTTLYHPKTGEVLADHPLGCLDKRSIQLFIKRLRRANPDHPIRYFACGEYGELRGRPHYHLVIWGLPPERSYTLAQSWSDPHTSVPYCDPDRLDVQLPRSDWDVGQYCSSYVMKKLTKRDDPRLEGRPPEFFLQSKSMGLGAVAPLADALSSLSSKISIEREGDIPRILIIDGRKMPIDRYLRGKLLDAIQKTEALTQKGQTRFADEMQSLLVRASQNPKIPKAWLTDPKRKGWALSEQYSQEQSQACANLEAKTAFSNKGTKL